jgi:hypothetical protein
LLELAGKSRTSWSLYLGAAAGLVLGLFAIDFVHLVNQWGHDIPTADKLIDYLTGVLWAVFFGISIFFWPVSVEDKRALLKLWGVRCAVTLGVMLFYENIYPLDAYQYYLDAKEMFAPLTDVGFGNGTPNLSAITWALNHLMPFNDSYHALKVVFSMFGLIGTFLFYRGAVRFTGKSDLRLLYILGLFPSMLFWSSILGKDPITFFAIALYFYGVVSWIKTGQRGYFVPLITGIALASSIRMWSGIVMIAPLLAIAGMKVRNKAIQLLMIAAGLAATLWIVQSMSVQFGVDNADTLVTSTNEVAHSWSAGGSALAAPEFTSIWSLISFAPLGMFTALFRPLPGEVTSNIFGLLAGLENLAVLGLAVVAVRKMRFATFKNPFVIWATTMVLVWSLLYAFVSYQNMGSAVRFKLQILPVLLSLLLYIVNEKKLSCAESPEV